MNHNIFLFVFLMISSAASHPIDYQTNPILDEINKNMVFVKGGTFTMGTNEPDANDGEKPAHQVSVSSFYISKYEVTQKQWKAVMDAERGYFKGDDLPVEYVSWNRVQEFIEKLNTLTGKAYRLPTEAEWEFAARGGNQSKGYKYAGSDHLNEVAWYGENSDEKTHPVGQKKANELGLYDMNGNVWEYCSDWFRGYSSASQTNPQGPASGSERVVRGGTFRSINPRVSMRGSFHVYNQSFNCGFRLAYDEI